MSGKNASIPASGLGSCCTDSECDDRRELGGRQGEGTEMALFHVMRGCRGSIPRNDQGRGQESPSHFRLRTNGCPFLGRTLAWQFLLIAEAKIRIFVKRRDGEMEELPQS